LEVEQSSGHIYPKRSISGLREIMRILEKVRLDEELRIRPVYYNGKLILRID